MHFCNIKLDNLTLVQAKEEVGVFLVNQGQYKIFTPNPEFVVFAQKNANFRENLDQGDLNICDGTGLSLFSGCSRIPGSDFMIEICKIAAGKNVGIYLLGSGNDDIVRLTAEKLQSQIPGLKICGYDKGPKIDYRPQTTDYKYEEIENQVIINKINDSKAQVLFVAFGMGKQEQWINDNLSKLSNVKIVMGVGGTFDYLSGSVRRAPCFLRKIGLEWLYRLIKQPKRLGRIFNAIVVFTYIAIKDKIFKKYDKN